MVRKSFTMVELIVVMVIIGIIAVFSIPNFTKTINRARARDGVLNLNVIHSSNVLFRVRNGVNVGAVTAPGGSLGSVGAINAALGLNILASGGATYVCTTGTTCVANAGGVQATVNLNQALTATNPGCPTVGTACF